MRFSSSSSTRSCISRSVAPGHIAAMVNTLIVKVGSSARPSFKKAKMPAATIAISKNRVIAFSRTARADRLRNCFAAESGTWSPELPRSGIDFSFFCDLWCWLIEFLPCSQRARVDHREANERKRYDLLSWVQVPADGCQFFTQLPYLHRLKCDGGRRRVQQA